ncbi:hypothetical protein [Azospirillum thermophilum]|nr:hypothetical protein [Azospirillum thermophilum]
MAEDPRKVGVYDNDTTGRTGAAGHMSWWIIALIALVVIVALYLIF